MIIVVGQGIVERGVVLEKGNLIFLRLDFPRPVAPNTDPFEPLTDNQSDGTTGLFLVAIDYQKRPVNVGDLVVFHCRDPFFMEIDDEAIVVWYLDEIDTIRIGTYQKEETWIRQKAKSVSF